jgi:hypothetical protein
VVVRWRQRWWWDGTNPRVSNESKLVSRSLDSHRRGKMKIFMLATNPYLLRRVTFQTAVPLTGLVAGRAL